MQSFGKVMSSACIRTENKSLEMIREESDMDKYFKESISFLKASLKSDRLSDEMKSRKNDESNIVSNIKDNLEYACYNKEPNVEDMQSKNLKIQKESKSQIKGNPYIKKNHDLYNSGKENIKIKRNNTLLATKKKKQLSNSTSSMKDNKSEVINYTKNTEDNISNNVSTSLISCASKLSSISNVSSEGKSGETHSYISTQDRCKLAVWGLPSNILQNYEARGVSNMFPWQVECLSNHNVIEEKRNLIYSAPTSAGKTLVAEILIIKTVLESRKKVIFILPYVSVVREKMYYFQDLLSDSGIRVEGFMGGTAPPGGFSATHIAIATIEKANSLVNRLMEEKELANLGAVVVDELHLVGDPNRGYLLELLLTKLKYMSLRDESIHIQLIGMSATLPNLSLLANWLDAELYKTDFRPIPLNEQCKIDSNIYDNKLNPVRLMEPLPELTMDTDNILQLCIETISDGHSVLIFCPTKNWCEKLAEQIAMTFFKLGQTDTNLGKMLRQQLDSTLISETLEQLKRSPTGLDNVLKNTVSFGIAFHHAGLTMDERDIIEGSFRSNSLRVLVATSTLSSGVNLPARRVIIRSPIFGGKVLDSLAYKQMIGRAGRMGKDTAGESILVCKANEKKAAESLLSATLDPIVSCLEDSAPLIRALLEAIASEVVFTPSDLELYTNCTLLSLTELDQRENPAEEAIKFLIDNEFLLLQKTDAGHRWIATALGKACLAASVPPKDALVLLDELQKARRCFVLDTELHVIYLVTPLNAGNQISTIDWMAYLEIWKGLSESERRVGLLVGVEERYLASAIRGIVKPGKTLRIHKRFFTALALHDLVRETPLSVVCRKYSCCRGVLQSLQQTAATFAGMVTQFCKQLRWDCMELLVSQFQTRLQFGVCRELLDLLRLPMLNGLRARSLYKQGITNIAELAVANELDVEHALHKALPFESEREQDGEHESEALKRKKMRTVFVTGRDGLTPHEAAIMLVQEARRLVQNELRLSNVPWKSNESSVLSESSTRTSLHSLGNAESMKHSNHETDLQISSIKAASNEVGKTHDEINRRLSSIKETSIQPAEESRNTPIPESPKSLIDEVVEDESTKSVKPTGEIHLNSSSRANSPFEKCSIDFFDVTNTALEDCTEKRHSTKSLSSFDEHDASEKDVEENIPNKKAKISVNEEQNTDILFENMAMDNLNTGVSMESKVLKSPSLFDDSLNLDTEIYNVLDENIIDTLQLSKFDNLKSIENKSPNEINLRSSGTCNLYNSPEGTNTNSEYKLKNPSTSSSLQAKPLTWKDDSWNESKLVIEKLNGPKNNINEQTPKIHSIKNIKNTNISQILKTSGTNSPIIGGEKKTGVGCEKSLHSSNDLKRIPQQCNRFNEIPIEKASVANFIPSHKNRKVSLESNKSDVDEVILASQNINTPPASIKARTRLNSEQKLNISAQKSTKLLSLKRVMSDNEHTPKSKLKEIRKYKDCSIDSIVSNSDEDTPIKTVKSLQRSRITLKKRRSDPEICLGPQKSKNINETTNWNTLNIVKVGSDRGTFNLFRREVLGKKYIALALNCEMYTNDTNVIGSKVISSTNTEKKKRSKKVENYVYENRKLCGAAISWENNIAYYICFSNTNDLRISGKEQLKLLKELLSNSLLYVKCFATKETFKMLYYCCAIIPACRFLDAKVASWLYDSTVYERTFHDMVSEYFPQGHFLTRRIDSCYDIGPGLNIKSTLPGEFRASAEVVLIWYLTDVLLDKLENQSPTLLYTFKEVEMRTVTLLASMELTGLGVCLRSLQDLSIVIREEMTSLENRAYTLAGRKFSFSSSKEVGEVLGLYKGKKTSVNKAVLEQTDHPISNLVMSWRKLNGTQTKIVYPILNLVQNESRIHGNCVTCTVTGRISMHEPNLQNVPKDFNSVDNSYAISVRMAFVAGMGNVILSADYCQLELRILAHFSRDASLCEIMRKPGDIFRNIAAKWNHVSEEEVDDQMRQRTKQLCYGMIYGMGVKSLAETLSVDEMKAKEFMTSFMNAYPGIRKWLDKVLEDARKTGYITTLLERRRVLPGLTSSVSSEKSQAERQAVNTKVQGSAADIAKKAMVNIEDRMRYEFPNSPMIMPNATSKRKLRSNTRDTQIRGGYLILQLHDELLYEVNMNDLQQVARIIRESMEQVCQLAVPLPVKIRVGSAWGELSEYNCK